MLLRARTQTRCGRGAVRPPVHVPFVDLVGAPPRSRGSWQVLATSHRISVARRRCRRRPDRPRQARCDGVVGSDARRGRRRCHAAGCSPPRLRRFWVVPGPSRVLQGRARPDGSLQGLGRRATGRSERDAVGGKSLGRGMGEGVAAPRAEIRHRRVCAGGPVPIAALPRRRSRPRVRLGLHAMGLRLRARPPSRPLPMLGSTARMRPSNTGLLPPQRGSRRYVHDDRRLLAPHLRCRPQGRRAT
jgi:hypothetical protein